MSSSKFSCRWFRCFLFVITVIVLFWPSSHAVAFDTGHHSDLCFAALSDLQFSPDAIGVVQMQNWLADYYVGPTSPSKEDFEKLHFDDLYNYDEINNYWNTLSANTKRAVQAAATANDQTKFLTILGISLHAVQDFYTHSNWVDQFQTPSSNVYDASTWYSNPISRSADIYTGWYKNKVYPKQPAGSTAHGGYTSGMNHDSYVRPNWDKAYVHAFAGSWEWASNCLDWAKQANANFDGRNISLSNSDKSSLATDLSAAYRISEWISGSVFNHNINGHWKGNGSGNIGYFSEFSTQWTLQSDSIFVACFKSPNSYEKLLTAGLYSGVPDASTVPTITSYDLTRKNVFFLRTNKVAPTSGSGQVYAVSYVQSSCTTAGQVRTDPSHKYIDTPLPIPKTTPQWTVPHFHRATDNIRVKYQLWKEGGLPVALKTTVSAFYGFAPNALDTQYTLTGNGHTDYEFNVNMATNSISGDAVATIEPSTNYVFSNTYAANSQNPATVDIQVFFAKLQFITANTPAPANPWAIAVETANPE